VARYQEQAAGDVDLAPILGDLRSLRSAIAAWRADAERRLDASPDDAVLRRRLNATLRRLARILVPINYARGERFDHDPAVKLPAVPRLEAAALVAGSAPAVRPFIRTALLRERNKLRAMLRQAAREVEF
jgi:N-acetylated-alpha-linked acidic dipeptidase